MNEIISFNNEEFGNIRTVMIDNEPWFVGKDICDVFGDTNHNRSLGKIDDEDKIMLDITDSLGRIQKAIYINESGLYDLMFSMQPQKANKDNTSDAYPTKTQSRIEKLKRFKRWVTHEVIPNIRKTGRYEINKHDDQVTINSDDISTLIQMNSKLIEQNQELLSIIKENVIDNKSSLHKDSPYNKIIETSDYPVSITVIANDYGIRGRKLNSILLDLGIQNKNNGYWTLNDEYNNSDYTTTIIYTNKEGIDFPNTRWTKNGRKFIYDLLKRQNLLPICEK